METVSLRLYGRIVKVWTDKMQKRYITVKRVRLLAVHSEYSHFVISWHY